MLVDHKNILIELNKSVKTLHFYPKGHPTLKAHLTHFHESLKKAAAEQGEIKWTIDHKGVYSGGKPIAPGFEGGAALAKQFFLRKIKTIVFRPDVGGNDIPALISLLDMEPPEILAEGGAEKVLAKKGVTGLLLNEMSYEEFKTLEEEVKEEQEAMAEGEEEEEEAEEAEGEGQEEEPPPPPPLEEPAKTEETLAGLLEELRDEQDEMTYNDLSVRINEKASPEISEGVFDEAFEAMLVYCEHGSPGSELSEGIKKTALERLGELTTAGTIAYLITRLVGREESHRETIVRLLYHAGEEGISLLLDALIDEREAHARRRIYNTLVKYGERIRPEVEKRLSDERWYAVRQMASLLGALGGQQSLDALEQAYAHPDKRVKKEVFKSLARIPSEKSFEILMDALKNGDRAIQDQAIISLAMLKDPAAVDTIGRIAVKKDAFSENLEQRKEAVKALGITRNEKAVPYLTKLLFKKGWFGKRDNEEIRSLAVISLGKIGGGEALDAVERISGESTGELYNTCRRVLEGRK